MSGAENQSEKSNRKNWWDGITPVTYEDLLERSENWTLGADAATATLLQSISSKIISRTHEVEAALKNVTEEAEDINVTLCNVTSAFHLLSNTQFTENRTYQDDERTEVVNKTPKEKEKENSPVNFVTSCKDAISEGLRLVSGSYVKVEISDSDSEEGQGSPLTVYKHIDPYSGRKLPHIIGSTLFYSDDTLGLYEKSPGEENNEEEVSSVCSLENEKTSDHEGSKPIITTNKSEEESESDELISSALRSQREKPPPSPLSTSLITPMSAHMVGKRDYNNALKESSKHYISVHNGFTSSSDNDEPLFGPPPATNVSRHSSKQSLTSDQMTHGKELAEENSRKSRESTPSGGKVRKVAQRSTLFDSDSEEEGLFSVKKPVKTESHSGISDRPKDLGKKPTKSLFSSSGEEEENFDSEPENSLENISESRSVQKKPVGGINIFSSEITKAIRKQHNSNSSQEISAFTRNSVSTPVETINNNKSDSCKESDERLFGANSEGAPSEVVTPKKTLSQDISNSSKSTGTLISGKPAVNSLFLDEDDGLFNPSVARSSSPPPFPNSKPTNEACRVDPISSIFDDSDEEDLFTPIRQISHLSNVQDSASRSVTRMLKPPPLPESSTPPTISKERKIPSKSIFDSSSSEEEMFIPRKLKASLPEKKKVSLPKEPSIPSVTTFGEISVKSKSLDAKVSHKSESTETKTLISQSPTSDTEEPKIVDNVPAVQTNSSSKASDYELRKNSKVKNIFSSDEDDIFLSKSVINKPERNPIGSTKNLTAPSQSKPHVTGMRVSLLPKVCTSVTDDSTIVSKDKIYSVPENTVSNKAELDNSEGAKFIKEESPKESVQSPVGIAKDAKLHIKNIGKTTLDNLFNSSDEEDIFLTKSKIKEDNLSTGVSLPSNTVVVNPENSKLESNDSGSIKKLENTLDTSDEEDIFRSVSKSEKSKFVGKHVEQDITNKMTAISSQESEKENSVPFLETKSNNSKCEKTSKDKAEASIKTPKEKIFSDSSEDDIFKASNPALRNSEEKGPVDKSNTYDNYKRPLDGTNLFRPNGELLINSSTGSSGKISVLENENQSATTPVPNSFKANSMGMHSKNSDKLHNDANEMRLPKPSEEKCIKQKSSKGIFSSDSDEDIFKSSKLNIKRETNNAKQSIFSDNDDNEDIFSNQLKEPEDNIFKTNTKTGNEALRNQSSCNNNNRQMYSKSGIVSEIKSQVIENEKSTSEIIQSEDECKYSKGKESSVFEPVAFSSSKVLDNTDKGYYATSSKLNCKDEIKGHLLPGEIENKSSFESSESDKKNNIGGNKASISQAYSNQNLHEQDINHTCNYLKSSHITSDEVSSAKDKGPPSVNESYKSPIKKPLGGVALFGGNELLSKLKKRKSTLSDSSGEDEDKASEHVNKKPTGGVKLCGGDELISKLKVKRKSDAVDAGSENKNLSGDGKREKPNLSRAVVPLVKSQSVISCKLTSEGIITSSQQTHSSVSNSANTTNVFHRSISQEPGVSFDDKSRASDFLVSLNKDRPKIQHHRKRPSRRIKRKNPRESEEESISESVSPSISISSSNLLVPGDDKVMVSNSIVQDTSSENVSQNNPGTNIACNEENEPTISQMVTCVEKKIPPSSENSGGSNIQEDYRDISEKIEKTDNSAPVVDEISHKPRLKSGIKKFTIEDIFGDADDCSLFGNGGNERKSPLQKVGTKVKSVETPSSSGTKKGEDFKTNQLITTNKNTDVIEEFSNLIQREEETPKTEESDTGQKNVEERERKILGNERNTSPSKKRSTMAKTLFEDDDMEEDLFSSVTSGKSKRKKEDNLSSKGDSEIKSVLKATPALRLIDKKTKKYSSIFSDDDEDDEPDLMFSTQKVMKKVVAPKIKTGKQAAKSSILFSDDEDSENDLFSSRGTKQKREKRQAVEPIKDLLIGGTVPTKKDEGGPGVGAKDADKPSFVDPLMGSWT